MVFGFGGGIAEVIGYASVLSTAQITEVEGYLKSKYGV